MGVVDQVIKGFFKESPPKFLEAPFRRVTEASGRRLFEGVDMAGVEATKARGSTPVNDLGLPSRGFTTGNPTIIEIQDRADVSADQVVAAAKEALERKFGPAPCTLDFQATAFVGQKP